jgi:hypothetical protein
VRSAPVRHDHRTRGWLALAVSLSLHAVLAVVLARLSARAEAPRAAADGPPTVCLVMEVDEPQGPPCLIPAPGHSAKSGGNEGVIQVSVREASENIAPTPQRTEQPPALASIDPAVFGQAGWPCDGAGSERGSGGAGSAALFEGGTPARSVVYVIDRSASMGPGGLLATAVRELSASLVRLPTTTMFQVILYHDQPELLLPARPPLLPATTENVLRASRLLAEVRAEGGTDHLRALHLALSLGAEVLYLLTDADDLNDADRREVTRLNRGRAVIHTIELNTANRGRADMPLQVLARENRGSYRAVDLQIRTTEAQRTQREDTQRENRGER